MRRPARAAAFAAALLALAHAQAPGTSDVNLGAPREIARGVSLYHIDEPHYRGLGGSGSRGGDPSPPAPISIWILRVDPSTADVRAALANDEIVGTETVGDLARRHGAVAAVNAGFFLLPAGDPAGIYKLDGQLVSDTRRPRGAVGIVRDDGPVPRLIFGRVAATMALRIRRRARPDVSVEIAGVDTTRQLGKLMLFTPAYHAHTDTAPGGLEWVIAGRPPRVVGEPSVAGKTPIPRDGFVLSFGGPRAPPPLASLRPDATVAIDAKYSPVDGSSRDWSRARDIVGGAGLLLRDGRPVEDWSVEQLTAGFAETRHPRTLVGARADGSIWLVTVDGRQPQLSAGMTLPELRSLASRLGLRDALNLDGGGSTTMWAAGRVVNSPSDAAGPRKVSDALLVLAR
jgi:hypothetical protein